MPDHLHFDIEKFEYYTENPRKKKIITWLLILLTSIAFGFIFFLLFILLFKTPKQKELSHKIDLYDEVIRQSSSQFELYRKKLKELKQYDQWISEQIFEDTLTSLTADEEKEINNIDLTHPEILLKNKLQETDKNIQRTKTLISIEKTIMKYLAEHDKFIEHLPIRVPLPEKKYTLVSGFGKRIHPIFKILKQHNGIDFSVRAGTPVFASAAGTVIPPPINTIGYGNVVCIDHENGYMTLYAQLLEAKVKPYTKVRPNDVIGLVGNSGISYGPHLHYEIWYKGKPVDPIDFLLNVHPKMYFQMYKNAKQLNQSLS